MLFRYDYDLSSEAGYDVLLRPQPALVKSVQQSLNTLYDLNIFQALGLNVPSFSFSRKSLGSGHIAKYLNGTASNPHFVLDMKAHTRFAQSSRLPLDDVLEMTIAHESGHAFYDSTGLNEVLSAEVEEEVVEAFAEYVGKRDVEFAFRLLMKPAISFDREAGSVSLARALEALRG